ncbi:hypothetical protein [Hymenobacter lucidus]|uniref:Uncharacterized protein n=1 Tax=Hymenobacter lucidus TaxID=2880930 RepID=A0ABS8ASN9_9BACT|nr:hypothetical protein [Hymenobacter lucidus]MCB2408047.1 hypothetical protein [Hymenobacter lucidus]
MNKVATKANILITKNFERRAARWASYISKANSKDLQQCFLIPGPAGIEKRLNYVSFSTLHLSWLISTVGVRHIQVRFLVAPPSKKDPGSKARFTMALYATDALGARISAYYLPVDEDYITTTTILPEKNSEGEGDPSDDAGQAPHDLVKSWVHHWTSAPEIKSSMFANSYGPLQGYTFSLDDFLQELFEVQPFSDEQMVRISFGLHEYYPAVPVKSGRIQTFGLVLRVFPAPKPTTTGANSRSEVYNVPEQSDAPFFDLSTPCPPGY